MKAVLQRVLSASVSIDAQIVGEIGRGYLLLVGVEKGDDEAQVAGLVDKVLGLRLFANEQGKLDYDIRQVNGSVLVSLSSRYWPIPNAAGGHPLQLRRPQMKRSACIKR